MPHAPHRHVGNLDRAFRFQALEHTRPRRLVGHRAPDACERHLGSREGRILADLFREHVERRARVELAPLLERRAVLAPARERHGATCAEHALRGIGEATGGEHGGEHVGAVCGG